MKRKTGFIFLLVLAMLLNCVGCAMADTETMLRDVSVDLVTESNRLVVTIGKSEYLTDSYGKKLSEGYESINSYLREGLYVVKKNTSDVHREGVIDGDGKVIVPAQYGDVEVLSSRWQAGFRLKKSSDETGDYTFTNYSTNKKTYYYVDTVDLYYNGNLVGTLERTDYQDGRAHGDYLSVRRRDGSYTAYNRNMEKSPYKSDYSWEYDTQYKSGKTHYYHCGSGQEAFTAGCTLTPDEVEVSLQTEKGQIIDLQGNVVATLKQNYDSVYTFEGDYSKVRIFGKYGLIDKAGNEILEPAYDDISYYYTDSIGLGFVGVVQNDLFGYVSLDGQMNADFTYGEAAVQDRGTFAYIKDLTGKIIVISGLVGELPDHYADVNIRTGARAFVAKNDAGQEAVIGLNGKVLVPFGEYRSLYVNDQGTVAAIYLGDRNYQIINIDEGAATAVEKPEAPANVQETAGGTWTCSNGHEGNTGNFCPECGEQKPLICPNCGATYPNDGSVKFCPNCGQNLQQ